MGQVSVVDRGSREIVVFLRGDVDQAMEARLDEALSEVTLLERLDDLHRVIVDTREVTSFDEVGVRFLRKLEREGKEQDYELAFAMTSPPVTAALEQANWPYATGVIT